MVVTKAKMQRSDSGDVMRCLVLRDADDDGV